MPIFIPPIVYWIGLAIAAYACGGGGRPRDKQDGCAECHTSPKEAPTSTFNMYGRLVSDAHRFHLGPRVRAPLSCADCHPVPQTVWGSSLHPNKTKDVTLDGFDSAEKSCVVYCHGDKKKTWPVIDNATPAVDCISCHKKTNPEHDITDTNKCYTCHDKTVDEEGNILPGSGSHMNGAVDVNRDKACVACHGQPPASHLQHAFMGRGGEQIKVCANCHLPVESPFKSGTHQDGVPSFKQDTCTSCHESPPNTGAHRTHAITNFFSGEPITCDNCHTVPLSENPPVQSDLIKHMTAAWRRVAFSGMAVVPFDASAPDASYNAGTCSAVYCHGGRLPEWRTISPPVWTDSSGRWGSCGACHGLPPSSAVTIHDPEDNDCTTCHIVRHNGKVELQ